MISGASCDFAAAQPVTRSAAAAYEPPGAPDAGPDESASHTKRSSRNLAHIDRSMIGPDTPLRLDIAASIAYPDGSMTANGLRREISKGRLECERTAGKLYVTLAGITDMRQKCRDVPKVPASIAANAAVESRSGLSSTERMKSARVAAQTIAEELKKSSPTTSVESTRQTGKILTLQR
jgi:hypothetical protein